MREDHVTVKSASDGGVHFATPGRVLAIAAGETASTWANGSPITRQEFDAILAPENVFALVELEEKASA
jgi:hypothetical protein